MNFSFSEKNDDKKKGGRPPQPTTTTSDLTEDVENLTIENGDSISTKNQNGSS